LADASQNTTLSPARTARPASTAAVEHEGVVGKPVGEGVEIGEVDAVERRRG
jgi:hypothetical protein